MYILDGIAYADDPTPLLKIRDIRPMSGYRLWVRFSTEEIKVVDCTNLLSEPAFVSLRDPSLFCRVSLDYGVPVWNGGEIDVAPEYLYENGTDAGNESAS